MGHDVHHEKKAEENVVSLAVKSQILEVSMKNSYRSSLPLTILLCLFIAESASADPVRSASVELKSVGDSSAKGKLVFTQVDGKVKIEGELTGLTPGEHGFHVHEHGDCGGDKAAAAGGHFNPTKSNHGSPVAAQHHAGDLGNIRADASGHAFVSLEQEALSLSDDHSIIGRTVILHAKSDDLVSQPAGDSGDRVACGVIVQN